MLKHRTGELVDRICLLWHFHASRCVKKAKISFAVTVLPTPVFSLKTQWRPHLSPRLTGQSGSQYLLYAVDGYSGPSLKLTQIFVGFNLLDKQ